MTKFADQLYDDLMREHGTTLRATRLPEPARGGALVKRGAWLAGGAGALTVGITASVTALSGGAPAYAVTQHPDGTVTVGISHLSGIPGANARLRALGDDVVAVPVEPGCPSITSLPVPSERPGRIEVGVEVGSSGGTVTVHSHGIPRGDVLVLGVADTGRGTAIDAWLTSGKPPSCVSLPPGTPTIGSGTGKSSAGTRAGGGKGTINIQGGTTRGDEGSKSLNSNAG